MKNSKRLYTGLALATSMVFGFVGTSGAATCAVSDVTIDGMDATSCGFGTNQNTFQQDFNDPANWTVNLDSAGGIDTWNVFEKEEGLYDSNGLPLLGNAHDGNTSSIGLSVSEIDDGFNSGTFSLNASSPLLITLTDGAQNNYVWYLFDGKSGALSGTFDASTAFDGQDVSTLSAYAVVPVPAAVWLFGSGLIGLVGLARRKKA